MTDRDIIREVAESDPLINFVGTVICMECRKRVGYGRIFVSQKERDEFPHADDCLWVYCVEKMKEREDGRINK